MAFRSPVRNLPTRPSPFLKALDGHWESCWQLADAMKLVGTPLEISILAEAFTFAFSYRAGNCWWWVPLVAPMLGAIVGIFLYNIFIDFHNRPGMENSSFDERAKKNWESMVATELQNTA